MVKLNPGCHLQPLRCGTRGTETSLWRIMHSTSALQSEPIFLVTCKVLITLLLLLQVLDGLLWVWPDASSAGAAATAAAAVIPELNQPDEWEPRTDWFMRDMPISMETVVENVGTL